MSISLSDHYLEFFNKRLNGLLEISEMVIQFKVRRFVEIYILQALKCVLRSKES